MKPWFRCIALATLLLLGCADGRLGHSDSQSGVGARLDDMGNGATGIEPTDSLAESEPTPAQWTAGIVRQDHAASATAILVEVRTDRNEGFDRVVLEFDGEEFPSYHLEYVDRPIRRCGSGDVVPTAGDGWLLVRLEPAQAHDADGRRTIPELSFRPVLPILREVTLVCDFEARVEWIVAVASPNRYRVMELLDPPRLLIDIRY